MLMQFRMLGVKLKLKHALFQLRVYTEIRLTLSYRLSIYIFVYIISMQIIIIVFVCST